MALSAPLPEARPLLPLEGTYAPADLAPGISEATAAALIDLRAELQLLAGCDLTPGLRALAEEINGTAAHLAQLAERFAAAA